MRLAFVHEAVLRLEPGADPRGPGGAVTAELCGHWQHEGTCRWPHLTTVASRSGDDVTVRILFGAEPEEEQEVRSRIAHALQRGSVHGAPAPSAWIVLRDGRDELCPEEIATAQGLARR
jgi:hypothetical protein